MDFSHFKFDPAKGGHFAKHVLAEHSTHRKGKNKSVLLPKLLQPVKIAELATEVFNKGQFQNNSKVKGKYLICSVELDLSYQVGWTRSGRDSYRLRLVTKIDQENERAFAMTLFPV